MRRDFQKEKHLICDFASVVLEGELWQRHLWPGIQWLVCMVIVAFLKEGVICCLAIAGRYLIAYQVHTHVACVEENASGTKSCNTLFVFHLAHWGKSIALGFRALGK